MKNKILILLFVVAFVGSLLLSITPLSETCIVAESTCSVIEKSIYSDTFGIKNSLYGVGIFAIMIILAYSQIRKPRKTKQYLINLGTTIGAIIAIYFLYLQQFILKAYCQYCLIVDISIVLALIVLIISSRITKRKLKKWTQE